MSRLSSLAAAYVGTDEVSGELQLDLLIREGLRPDSSVLDMGCGCLHAGVPLIRHLRAWRYCGVDPNEWLRLVALEDPAVLRLVEEKCARFSSADDFDSSRFDVKFDFVLSHSVLSHCALWQLYLFLKNVKAALALGGCVLASVRLAEGNAYGSRGSDGGGDSEDSAWQYPGVSWFRLSTVESVASVYGLTATLVPEYTAIFVRKRPTECHDWVTFRRAP